MHIFEPYFVIMETCLFQRSRSTKSSMMYATLECALDEVDERRMTYPFPFGAKLTDPPQNEGRKFHDPPDL